MKLGWLWLSILNTQASPSPMSMTPAFSPGPWITCGAEVGRPRRCLREDLYEQCSFHMAETMPSSVRRRVAADEGAEARVFVGGQSVLAHQLGRDRNVVSEHGANPEMEPERRPGGAGPPRPTTARM